MTSTIFLAQSASTGTKKRHGPVQDAVKSTTTYHWKESITIAQAKR